MRIPQIVEENKQLFGAYSAMALSNIRNILDHISTLGSIENAFDPDSDSCWNHPTVAVINPASHNRDAAKETFVIEKLSQHFPFLPILAEEKRKNDALWAKKQYDWASKNRDSKKQQEMLDKRKECLTVTSGCVFYVLNMAFHVLKAYRDHCAHRVINDPEFEDESKLLKFSEQPLSNILNNYFTVALRDSAKKYSYSTEDMGFIQNCRYKAEGRKKVPDTSFFLSILGNSSKPKAYHISGVGVAMLICMFLEKKYVNVFLQKLPIYGSYKKQSEEANIIRNTFGIHTAKLPKDRIVPEKNGFSVAMDMLNEMKRCPKELFGTLSYPDQNAFRIISSDMNDVLQVRHTDRFAQLSLEYIDFGKLFKDIRFQVNMGKLRYLKSADKHCIDGVSRVRVLERKINGFGRIQEMEAKRKEEGFGIANLHSKVEIRGFDHVKRDDANPDSYPYVVDTYTRYVIENNKICLSIGDYWPHIEKLDDETWRVVNEIPICRMSALELPAMMFHLMLCGSEATESLIKKVAHKYQKLFEAMAQGKLTKDNIGSFGIAMANIPQKVIDCVKGKTSGKSIKGQIEKEVEDALTDTNIRIERLKTDKRSVNSAQNKMGKRGFRSIQPGKLADWLAADIVKHQPSKYSGNVEEYGTDRLTGMNYRVMQSALATFNGDVPGHCIEEIKQMFAKAQLVQSDGRAHPFLGKVLNKNPQNTVDFYEKYLVARRAYYQHLLERLQNGEKVTLPYLNGCRNKWRLRNADFYKTMGELYSEEMPIELPRQMFDAAIKATLKKMPSMQEVDLEHSNVTFLIGEYLKRELKDDFQPFYEWKRNYRYTDMMICEVNRSTRSLSTQFIPLMLREEIWEKRAELSDAYKKWAIGRLNKNPDTRRLSETEKNDLLDKRIAKCRNEYQKNEKTIRRYKVQDAVMFMMVKAMFDQKSFTTDSKQFSLSLIMPDAERGILSEVMPIDFTFYIDGEKYTIHSNGMKLKNYGDFFRLINDKRMKSLARTLSNHIIDKDLLVKEFDAYDDHRPSAIEIIFEFERCAYEKHPELLERVENEERLGFGNLLTTLQNNDELSKEDSFNLSQIRNAFCHNAYPRSLKITSNIPEVAKDLIGIFKSSNPFEKK